MLFGLIWFIGFASLVGLAGTQFLVIYLISKFENQNQNPLESSASLTKTTKPTMLLYLISMVAFLLTFSYSWPAFLLQLSAGGFFFYYLNDKKQWFEPRYLFRDLNYIKIRHAVLCIVSSLSVIVSFLVYILK